MEGERLLTRQEIDLRRRAAYVAEHPVVVQSGEPHVCWCGRPTEHKMVIPVDRRIGALDGAPRPL